MPHAITSPRAAQALLDRAERLQTPSGDGSLVWHRWGHGRPTLLLHGGSGSWNHWVRNIDALVAAGRQVIAPDLPGFGDSARPEDLHDADGQWPLLEQGLQQVLGPTAVDAVGFSFGGLTAALWAQAYPGRFARLVLVGAPALSDERLPPLPLRLWDRAAPGPERDAIHRHNLRTLMFAHDESVDELAVALHAANLPRDRLRRRKLMLTDLLARTLPTLAMPVAGIWGEHDVLYRNRLDLVARVLATAPRYAGLQVVPDAGHWVQYERAEAFDQALEQALGQQPDGGV
jgi:2-hydroxy-6-oxonona-2,4-dienedioate hydrolase